MPPEACRRPPRPMAVANSVFSSCYVDARFQNPLILLGVDCLALCPVAPETGVCDHPGPEASALQGFSGMGPGTEAGQRGNRTDMDVKWPPLRTSTLTISRPAIRRRM